MLDDEDSDVRRSYSVDNENPQTPDESAEDMMSELLNTGMTTPVYVIAESRNYYSLLLLFCTFICFHFYLLFRKTYWMIDIYYKSRYE